VHVQVTFTAAVQEPAEEWLASATAEAQAVAAAGPHEACPIPCPTPTAVGPALAPEVPLLGGARPRDVSNRALDGDQSPLPELGAAGAADDVLGRADAVCGGGREAKKARALFDVKVDLEREGQGRSCVQTRGHGSWSRSKALFDMDMDLECWELGGGRGSGRARPLASGGARSLDHQSEQPPDSERAPIGGGNSDAHVDDWHSHIGGISSSKVGKMAAKGALDNAAFGAATLDRPGHRGGREGKQAQEATKAVCKSNRKGKQAATDLVGMKVAHGDDISGWFLD
jgi:hypothetical protein